MSRTKIGVLLAAGVAASYAIDQTNGWYHLGCVAGASIALFMHWAFGERQS